ncbi:indole-3-glycerol-phosphate synthase [Desulfovermiculus halophilus]|uniref:indole-3-glycerol-phosphate synthase n=1 Tax=Desulfovermiculus halophilus TaxID=339722 RepID=UPI000ACD8BCD|nr:indole-3-glycerol-phosphate synthase [Desulfovermiculus halophilus]
MSRTSDTARTRKTDMLQRFVRAKEQETARLELTYTQTGPPPACRERSPALASALTQAGPGAVIAEYKPASPSRGAIAPDLSPASAAELFARGGAAAVSVLTDRTFFGSSLDALPAMAGSRLPLLRKDFIIHPAQVTETAATPASAFLLIVRLFSAHPEGLETVFQAGIQAGLEPVVEVFNRRDLAAAKALGAAVILVNSRDLDTLELNMDLHRELIADREDNETWICASGLSSRTQILDRAELGYAACLIGTSIMDSPDRLGALRALTEGLEPQTGKCPTAESRA